MKTTTPRTAPGAAPTAEAALRNWPSPGLAALVFLGLALLYFIPALLPDRQPYGTDYLGGGYMFYHFIAHRLASGELPKWVPYVYGGMPLAANPASTYYPVFLLGSLILPAEKVLVLIYIVQFFLAGLGAYLLAAELHCRRWVAFLAGLAFEFTGLTMSWVYAGHDGRIIVATLAPLFLSFLHRGIRTGRAGSFVGAAATLGMALLSFQIQNAYYLLLAGLIWAVFTLIHLGLVRRPRALARVVAFGVGAVAVGFLLASVNYLPFVHYIGQSPRGGSEGRGYEFATSFSMPPAEVLALAVPEQFGASVVDPNTQQPAFSAYHGANGFKLHTEYVGALVIVLLALGCYYSRRNAYWWFFGGLSLFALTVAFGGNTPLYRLYYALLPGTKQFRAPSLIFFVVSLSLVTMAALTLERIVELRTSGAPHRYGGAARPSEQLTILPRIVIGVVVVAALGAMVATGGGGAASAPGAATAASGWVRFAIFAAAIGGALWAASVGRLGPRTAVVVLALLTITDLWIVDRRFFYTVGGPEAVFAPDDVVGFLQSQPAPNRIWDFPVPQPWHAAGANGGNYPMLFGIGQVGGEHPNPLASWIDYLGAGAQTYTDWHNFLSNPRVVNTPAGQAVAFDSQQGFLEAANVRYVVSMVPLEHRGFREVYRGSAIVYEDTLALPRAYLVPNVRQVTSGGVLAAMRSGNWDPAKTAFLGADAAPLDLPAGPLNGTARVTEYGPDRVVVQTTSNRAALLVLADNYYAGWQATVDGAETPVLRTNLTLRGVALPGGAHQVVFTYHPTSLYHGLAISLAAAVVLLVAVLAALVRRRRAPERDGRA